MPPALASRLIPDVSLVVFDGIRVKKRAILILKRDVLVVLFLVFDVGDYIWDIRLTDRKCTVTGLPMETREFRRLFFNPARRRSFRFLHDGCDRMVAREREQRMCVILHSADDERFTVVVSEHCREIRMHLPAYRFVG